MQQHTSTSTGPCCEARLPPSCRLAGSWVWEAETRYRGTQQAAIVQQVAASAAVQQAAHDTIHAEHALPSRPCRHGSHNVCVGALVGCVLWAAGGQALLATHPYVTTAAEQANAAAGGLAVILLHPGMLQKCVPSILQTIAVLQIMYWHLVLLLVQQVHCIGQSHCLCLAAVTRQRWLSVLFQAEGRHVGDLTAACAAPDVCVLVPQHVQSREAQPQALGASAYMRASFVTHSQLTAIMTLCCDTLQIWSWNLWFVGGVDILNSRGPHNSLSCVKPAGYNAARSGSSWRGGDS